MNNWISFLILIAVAFSGCSKKSELKSIRWVKGSEQGFPQPSDNTTITKKIKTEKYTIELGHSEINGFRVLGTHAKQVKLSGEKGVFFDSKYLNKVDRSVINRAKKMNALSNSIIALAKKSVSSLSGNEISHSEVVLAQGGYGWQPFILVESIDESAGTILRHQLDENAQLVKRERVDLKFAGLGSGTVLNFKTRSIEEVRLEKLLGNGSLQTPTVLVFNGVHPSANSTKHEFHYSPSEPNFNEVQVFYTLQFGMGWMRSKMGFSGPSKIDAKVYIGKTRPTNAAFYYRNRIRLGVGDGKLYRDIPRDQSIVLHELAHAYIDGISGLAPSGEPGAINEGLADYFAAVMLTNPKMAEYSYLKAPFKRTIKNKNRAFDDFTGKKYNDSLAISGTLWNIYELLGEKAANQFVAETLVRLTPATGFEELKQVFSLAKDEFKNVQVRKKIDQVLVQRNWK